MSLSYHMDSSAFIGQRQSPCEADSILQFYSPICSSRVALAIECILAFTVDDGIFFVGLQFYCPSLGFDSIVTAFPLTVRPFHSSVP